LYPAEKSYATSHPNKEEFITELEINGYLDPSIQSWVIISVTDWELTTYKPHITIWCSESENFRTFSVCFYKALNNSQKTLLKVTKFKQKNVSEAILNI